MHVWNVLHTARWNAGRKNDGKTRHLGNIAQLCRAISSQLRQVSTIGKKPVKQRYHPHMSLQYGELRPTSGWDRFVSLGHRRKFQGLSCLGSLTARYSSSGRQPNFAMLNRGHYLYSAGRPSHWALDHILVHKCCRCSSTTTDPCFHSRFLSNTCIAYISSLQCYTVAVLCPLWEVLIEIDFLEFDVKFHLALQFRRYVCEWR